MASHYFLGGFPLLLWWFPVTSPMASHYFPGGFPLLPQWLPITSPHWLPITSSQWLPITSPHWLPITSPHWLPITSPVASHHLPGCFPLLPQWLPITSPVASHCFPNPVVSPLLLLGIPLLPWFPFLRLKLPFSTYLSPLSKYLPLTSVEASLFLSHGFPCSSMWLPISWLPFPSPGGFLFSPHGIHFPRLPCPHDKLYTPVIVFFFLKYPQ